MVGARPVGRTFAAEMIVDSREYEKPMSAGAVLSPRASLGGSIPNADILFA
jgi:hypothetical protein